MTKPKLASDAVTQEVPSLIVEDSTNEVKPEAKPVTREERPDGIIVETY